MTVSISNPSCARVPALQHEAFLRIVEASTRITRHQDLYAWLQGEIQHFIPHDVLISAYGHFGSWQLKLDIISSLPGVRTDSLAQCEIDGLLQKSFTRWVEGGRQPFVLRSLRCLGVEESGCRCPLHAALRRMNLLLVHGVRDERAGCDCLYLAFNSGNFVEGCFSECFRGAPCFILNSLITQIDVSSRKMAALPGIATRPAAMRHGGPYGLTEREQEILEWVCKGKTNWEISIILDISCFTVKNHIQHIFQKIGVSNRVQAVTMFKQQLSATILQMPQTERRTA